MLYHIPLHAKMLYLYMVVMLQYLMKCYLKIEQRARKYQADGENILSSECNATPATEDSRPVTTITPTIHFVETSSSVLRELPWILVMEHKVCMQFISKLCKH